MTTDAMAARRCPMCLTNWPNQPEFEKCPNPQCEDEETDAFRNVKALDLKEARSLSRHYRFETMYAEWDETKAASRLDPASDPDLDRFTLERWAAEQDDAELAILLEPEEA